MIAFNFKCVKKEWMIVHEWNPEVQNNTLIHRPTEKVVGGPWWRRQKYQNSYRITGYGKDITFATFLDPTFELAILKIIDIETNKSEYRVLMSSLRKPSLIKALENAVCLTFYLCTINKLNFWMQ